MRKAVLPHLGQGGVVVCDRFADSTTAYQGFARGLDREFIGRMHALTVGGRWPDLTLLLDIEPDVGLRRNRTRDGAASPDDRFEAESGAFHKAVREGFLQLADAYSARIRIIDADAPVDQVHQRIMENINGALGRIQ